MENCPNCNIPFTRKWIYCKCTCHTCENWFSGCGSPGYEYEKKICTHCGYMLRDSEYGDPDKSCNIWKFYLK